MRISRLATLSSSLASTQALFSSSLRRLAPRSFTTTTTRFMSSDSSKPTYPADYQVPKVWQYNEATMKPVHGSNLPVSGAQTDKSLPVGQHDIQLYSLGTPNGIKASIMLEEIVEADPTFDYDAYLIHIGNGDQFTSGFVDINPNSKIPALYDQSNGARVFESGAILVYLAEKYNSPLLPSSTELVKRAETLSWVFFQVGAGPYYGGGGLSHFKGRAPMQWEYAIDRYTIETKRILDVLEQQLARTGAYLVGADYTIADIMHWKWTTGLLQQEFLTDGKAAEQTYPNLVRWSNAIAERSAVKRGSRVLGFGPDAITERHSRADLD